MAAIEAANNEYKTEKIHVVVRVRPLHEEETTQRSPWKLSSKSIVSSKTCRPSVASHSFTYDKVYGIKSKTAEIYEAHVKGIVNSTISGVHGTVIACGQSDTGKTRTMRGLPEESGILVLAVQDVFKKIQEEKDREFFVRVSYFELDNEEVNDLLASKKQKLDVHEDVEGGIVVAGLREEIVVTTNQVLALLEFADGRRTDSKHCGGRRHSIFQMVIESRLDNQENLLISQETAATRISVLESKPDRSFSTLDKVMSTLSENADRRRDSLLYSESKLTYFLKPSLGGNTRTCFIFHISPAMVQMDATVETLMFAAKTSKVINCLKANEIRRKRPMFKRQRREIEELRRKLKEDDSQDSEDVINHLNALLMIELEREKMSIELLEKSDHNEEKEEKIHLKSEFGCDDKNGMDDSRTYPQTQVICEYSDEVCQVEELQDVDHLSKQVSGELWLSLHSGTRRKARLSTGKVAEKFDQVDLLFQTKIAREFNCLKTEGTAARQLLTELRNLIEQQDNEQQEIFADNDDDDDGKILQAKLSESDKEKVMMEKRLHEQETTFSEIVESLKGQLAAEKERQVHRDLPAGHGAGHSCTLLNTLQTMDGNKQSAISHSDESSKGSPNFDALGQGTGLELLGSVVAKQHTEAQSCLSQEGEEHHNTLNETEGKQTPARKKSKANKVYQKYQDFQGRSEISTLRKELAAANETIRALADERNGLWRDLKRKKANSSRSGSEDQTNAGMTTEDIKGDNNSLQLLAAAVDELKAEVESTFPITDALLELVLEAFQTLNADLKSFQEGVADLNFLSCATADLSESLEKAKLQLVALRQGKLSSEKELNSMKSELATLECVVERQSGVLRVLSDNESLLGELSSVRAAMKEAASASELRLLSIQEESNSKLEDLECQCKNLKQENLQLEEKYSDIQCKLQSAQAEVHTLTQALEEKSELQKKQLDIDTAEKDELKRSQAIEKSKMEKKKKYFKLRQNSTQAEILRLTQSLGEKAELQEEIRKLEGDLSTSRAAVEKLEREVEDNYKARQEVLIQLKISEDSVVKLSMELEEKSRDEVVQGKKLACMENEVFKVTKLLEDTKLNVEAHQRELIISNEKVENLVRELEQMTALDGSYNKTFDRLVQSDAEVERLAKIISSQLEYKSILEQDQTNFMYKLEISESEITKLTSSLNIVLQEKELLEHGLNEVSAGLSNSESQVARLTETLVKEREERKTVEVHLETLGKLVKEQEKILGNNQELICKLTHEQQEKNSVQEIHQGMQEKLPGDEEGTKEWEEMNQGSHDRSISKEHEVGLLEKKNQGFLDKLASLETQVMQLTEKLAAGTREKSELENRVEEFRGQLEKEKEKEHEVGLLEKKNQGFLDKLASLETQVMQLTEKLAAGTREKSELENRVEEFRGQLEKEKEKEHEVGLLEKKNQGFLDKLASLETQVMQLTEKLAAGTREKSELENRVEEFRGQLEKEKEKWNILEEENQKKLEQPPEEHEKRELLVKGHSNSHEELKAEVPEKSNQSQLPILDGSEAQVAQLTEILRKEQEEKRRLEEHHQEILAELTGEQHEKRALTEKYEETLEKLAIAIEERDVLDKAQQNILDKLAVSEEKLGQLTEMSTTELQEKRRIERLEHRRQETIMEPTSDQEERLIQMNSERFEKVSRNEVAEVLKENHKNCLEMLARLEERVVELKESLASEVQNKDKLELEYGKVFNTFECLKTEVARLTGSLIRQIESKDNLERHHSVILAQLASSNAVVARVTANLADEVAEKEELRTDYSQLLTQFATSKMEVGNFTEMVDETPQVELHSIQLKLAVSEAELLRQTDEKRDSCIEEHKLLLLELDATSADIQSLRGHKERLQQEQVELLAKISSFETEIRRLNDELRDKSRLEEEDKDVNALKTQVFNLTATLREKSELEVEQQKMQLDLLSQQGEISKLIKALRASRKVVKDQKDLIHKLTNTQAEVLRLAGTLGGRPGSTQVQVDQSTATDPAFTGIPCENCGLLSLDEELVRLQKKLVSAEGSVAILGNVIEEKALLERKLESVQLELSVTQAEIVRLTAAQEDKVILDEHFKRFKLALSEAGLLRSGKDTDGYECSLDGSPSELLKMAIIDLKKLRREVESKAVELANKEQRLRGTKIASDAELESLDTIITQLEKERDNLREQCTVAENKVHDLSVEIEKQKALVESSEKKLKARCQKAERDALDLRAKLGKLEEATDWIVRDKGVVEERLTCCEVQLTAAREAARSTNKELELSHHQLHIRTSQLQSEMAALCEELSVNKAQKAELEAELHRLLGQQHKTPRSLQEAAGFSSTPLKPSPHFRVSQWPFPNGPGHNLDSTWGDGKW